MSLVLNLPTELETELSAQADRLGLPLGDYVLRLLAGGHVAPSQLRTGAELVAFWQREGLVGTRSDLIDSPAHARVLREQAQKRVHP